MAELKKVTASMMNAIHDLPLLVARDEGTARELLAAALGAVSAPVYADVADHAAPLQNWALAQGFAVQRAFTRMAHGPNAVAPGDASLVFCPAGPELG